MNDSQQLDYFTPFDWAVVRLATYVVNATSKPKLLFGSVSLLTSDRPRPKSGDGVERCKIAGGKSGTVFFRRTVLIAQEAVGWYRSVSADGVSTPVPSEPSECLGDLDGISIAPSAFVDDPEWPMLGVPAGSDLLSSPGAPGDPAPFIGYGARSARIHRRFGDNVGFESVTADPAAIAFLKRRLHLDLADYSEYLGSLVMVVPDPILRGVHHFLVPSVDGANESIVYRLVPRAGQNLSNLSLTVLERRANLLSRFQTKAVPPDGLVVIPMSLPVQASGYVVTHPIHGILAYQTPLPFIRQVGFSLGIVGRRVKVEAPLSESSRAKSSNYEVAEISHQEMSSVGAPASFSGLERVIEAEATRERRAVARRYEQTWFNDGERAEAMAFIRTRVGRARFSVLVADPYFAANQIPQFLHAVAHVDVAFTILTSRLAFELDDDKNTAAPASSDEIGRRSPKTSKKRDAESVRRKAFEIAISTFARRGIKNAQTLVLAGKTPPLHDRFLVIDETVWFLGNSLNTLGERASLILQVPDPQPVVRRLKRMQAQAIPFEQYARQRDATSPRKSGERAE